MGQIELLWPSPVAVLPMLLGRARPLRCHLLPQSHQHMLIEIVKPTRTWVFVCRPQLWRALGCSLVVVAAVAKELANALAGRMRKANALAFAVILWKIRVFQVGVLMGPHTWGALPSQARCET